MPCTENGHVFAYVRMCTKTIQEYHLCKTLNLSESQGPEESCSQV
jgi:hypothetical protein